jgi:hypothetical protein
MSNKVNLRIFFLLCMQVLCLEVCIPHSRMNGTREMRDFSIEWTFHFNIIEFNDLEIMSGRSFSLYNNNTKTIAMHKPYLLRLKSCVSITLSNVITLWRFPDYNSGHHTWPLKLYQIYHYIVFIITLLFLERIIYENRTANPFTTTITTKTKQTHSYDDINQIKRNREEREKIFKITLKFMQKHSHILHIFIHI